MERREGQQESARLAEWLLQIDRETIYAFVQRGLIPHSRIEANVVAGISKVSKCLPIDRNPVTDMGIQEVLSTPTDVDAELEQLTVDSGCTTNLDSRGTSYGSGLGIGSIRRECLDHVIVFNETSLRRTLRSYCQYYHSSRTHLSVGKDSPEPRSIKRRKWDQWWRCRRWEGCIIATNDEPPDEPDHLRATSAPPFEIGAGTALTCARMQLPFRSPD